MLLYRLAPVLALVFKKVEPKDADAAGLEIGPGPPIESTPEQQNEADVRKEVERTKLREADILRKAEIRRKQIPESTERRNVE